MELPGGDPLEEVFAAALKSRIFRRREVLLPDYVPDSLPHRENEIRRLGEVLAPALRGEKPSNVFIYGLTGTGKTAVARLVLQRLEDRAAKHGVRVRGVYVNVRQSDTPYRVVADISEHVGLRVPFTGLSVGEVYRRLVNKLRRLGGTYIIVLDEIDFLSRRGGDDLLYRLTRINQELGGQAKVAIVGITNSLSFVDNLEPRVRSSLGEVELVFPPYNARQLRDILESRAMEAFQPGVLAEGVVPLCAALAAREHGDARRALDLLRVAGEIAERRNDPVVTEEHVYAARMELEKDRVAEVVKTLPLHGKLVLLALMRVQGRKGGAPATTGEVYEEYRGLVSKLGLESVTLRRVSGILSELDMLGIIKSRIVSRGRYGKTRESSVEADTRAIVEALSEDPVVAEALEDE